MAPKCENTGTDSHIHFILGFTFQSAMQQKRPITNYNFSIISPGGNITALIQEIPMSSLMREQISNFILQSYPEVEQVGFINVSKNTLIMSGGELCVNAIRASSWLLLEGNPGKLRIKIEGLGNIQTGITKFKRVHCTIPITNSIKIDCNKYLVFMNGMTHCVVYSESQIKNKTPDEIKNGALSILHENGLMHSDAVGVIYVDNSEGVLKIAPVVYIKAIKTFFYETACGSGSAAVGFIESIRSKKSILDIEQPSGVLFKINVCNKKKLKYVKITGPVTTVQHSSLYVDNDLSYLTEDINSMEQFSKYHKKTADFYKKIFSEPPYYEEIKSDKIDLLLQEYVELGMMSLVRVYDQIIGFIISRPLLQECSLPLLEIAKYISIDMRSVCYIAELGIHHLYRKKHIATRLLYWQIKRIEAYASGVLIRTTSCNRAAISFYQKLGFSKLDGIVQHVSEKRIDGIIREDTRVFLFALLPLNFKNIL